MSRQPSPVAPKLQCASQSQPTPIAPKPQDPEAATMDCPSGNDIILCGQNMSVHSDNNGGNNRYRKIIAANAMAYSTARRNKKGEFAACLYDDILHAGLKFRLGNGDCLGEQKAIEKICGDLRRKALAQGRSMHAPHTPPTKKIKPTTISEPTPVSETPPTKKTEETPPTKKMKPTTYTGTPPHEVLPWNPRQPNNSSQSQAKQQGSKKRKKHPSSVVMKRKQPPSSVVTTDVSCDAGWENNMLVERLGVAAGLFKEGNAKLASRIVKEFLRGVGVTIQELRHVWVTNKNTPIELLAIGLELLELFEEN